MFSSSMRLRPLLAVSCPKETSHAPIKRRAIFEVGISEGPVLGARGGSPEKGEVFSFTAGQEGLNSSWWSCAELVRAYCFFYIVRHPPMSFSFTIGLYSMKGSGPAPGAIDQMGCPVQHLGCDAASVFL